MLARAAALSIAASIAMPAATQGLFGDVDLGSDDCPFCKYMAAGPCGSQFVAWLACIRPVMDAEDKEGRNRDGNRDGNRLLVACADSLRPLAECVDKHPDYYDRVGEDADDLVEAEDGAGGAGGGEASS